MVKMKNLYASKITGNDLFLAEAKFLPGGSDSMKKQCNTDRNEDLTIAQALSALIYASDWPKTRMILEERQGVLLSERALELLSFTVTELYKEGDMGDAQNWEQYKVLLLVASIIGIPLAWECFMNLISKKGR